MNREKKPQRNHAKDVSQDNKTRVRFTFSPKLSDVYSQPGVVLMQALYPLFQGLAAFHQVFFGVLDDLREIVTLGHGSVSESQVTLLETAYRALTKIVRMEVMLKGGKDVLHGLSIARGAPFSGLYVHMIHQTRQD